MKTDQRDAQRLLRLLMIDGLHPVRVPSTQEEALRDLVRAREDVRGDLMRARHRMGKLLLRHDVRFDGTAAAWTTHHRAWLGKVDLGDRGVQVTLRDYLGAIDALLVRRDTLEATIDELVPDSPWADTIARLRCLRGINTLSAVGLCAEIGDFTRFARPGQLMSYLGLVPSENSSGEARRQGAITKTGSGHGRRLLVEAAWHYRRPPAKGQPPRTPTNRAPAPRRSRRRREPSGPTRESIRDISVSNRFGGHARFQTAGSHDEKRSCGREGSAHNSLTTVAHPAGPAAPLDRHDARPSRGHPVLPT